jgi:small subunit ribosomal protein S20
MANIKSQIKRNRQNERRKLRNRSTRSTLKTKIKQFRQALDAGDRGQAETVLRDVSQALDKAAAKGVIHKNSAANRKSRLARRLGSSA